MALARQEDLGFRERAAQQKQKRDDEAAQEHGDPPSPTRQAIGGQAVGEGYADHGCQHDGDLLAGGLPAHEKSLAARRGNLRQVDGDAAELDSRGEPLQQAADEHQDGRDPADRAVARRAGDRECADGHEPQREQQALAPAMLVHVGAEHDGAKWPHEVSGAKRHQRFHERRELAAAREKRLTDGSGVVAEDHEVVHLEEVSAGDAENGPDLRAGAHHEASSVGQTGGHYFFSVSEISIWSELCSPS